MTQMDMIRPVVLLVLIDISLYLVLKMFVAVNWNNGGAVPLWLSLALCASVAIGHLAAAVYLLIHMDTPGKAGFAVTVLTLSGFGPVAQSFRMVVNSIAVHSVDQMYGWHSEASVATYDMTKGRRLALAGRHHDAIREYRKCFDQDPANSEALFAIAGIYLSMNDLESAIRGYRDIIHRFTEGSVEWTNAAYQLAMVYERNVGDEEMAKNLFREVIRRRPESNVGRLAADRLREMAAPTN